MSFSEEQHVQETNGIADTNRQQYTTGGLEVAALTADPGTGRARRPPNSRTGYPSEKRGDRGLLYN